MKRRLRLGLRLTAAILAVALITLTAASLVDRALGGIDEARIEERVRAAQAVGDGIGTWFQGAKLEVEAIAPRLEPWSGTPAQGAAARSVLDGLLSSTSVFDAGAIVVAPGGRVTATSTSEAAVLNIDRNSPHAQAALRGNTSVSGVFQDPLARVPVVAIATPLRAAGGRVTGALVATSRVAGPLSRVIKSYETDPSIFPKTPGVRILLVAPGGVTLASDTPEPLQRDVLEARLPAKQAQADSNPGFFEYIGESGVEKVAGYAQASDSWVVVLPQDAKSFFRFGTDFFTRLRSDGPTRAAAVATALILAAAVVALAALYRRLVRTEARAEDAKRAFLAIAGHELRTPLTSIRGFSQMLTSRWEKIPDKDRKELIQTVSRQARNLEHLVERLIVGAQLEAGMGPAATLRPVDAGQAIKQAAEQYRAMSKLHSIEVDVESPLSVEADAKMLQEILGHLLENALKYSPGGGTVWVKARRDGGKIHITVEDEGVGLPSDQAGIFGKFVQGEPADTRTHDEGGVGLGLYIIKTYLDRMHGAIRAERREPTGARFVVSLRTAR